MYIYLYRQIFLMHVLRLTCYWLIDWHPCKIPSAGKLILPFPLWLWFVERVRTDHLFVIFLVKRMAFPMDCIGPCSPMTASCNLSYQSIKRFIPVGWIHFGVPFEPGTLNQMDHEMTLGNQRASSFFVKRQEPNVWVESPLQLRPVQSAVSRSKHFIKTNCCICSFFEKLCLSIWLFTQASKTAKVGVEKTCHKLQEAMRLCCLRVELWTVCSAQHSQGKIPHLGNVEDPPKLRTGLPHLFDCHGIWHVKKEKTTFYPIIMGRFFRTFSTPVRVWTLGLVPAKEFSFDW